jgi:hypothetical protein
MQPRATLAFTAAVLSVALTITLSAPARAAEPASTELAARLIAVVIPGTFSGCEASRRG